MVAASSHSRIPSPPARSFCDVHLLSFSLPMAILAAIIVAIVPLRASAAARAGSRSKPAVPVFRWDESLPGCTFTESKDGKYTYAAWSGDVAVTVAVDAREAQIIRHRIEPIFGVLLTIRYRGEASLDLATDAITLQFVKHFKVVQPALDPDDYTERIQTDADNLDNETRRILEKHPEQKTTREAREQDYQKSITELIEFLVRDSLRPAHLDRARPEVSGWVFFDAANKWIGGWKPQEEFLLRVPVNGKIFAFPFKLPPKPGELLLQKRD
jgi:hypothetical protein